MIPAQVLLVTPLALSQMRQLAAAGCLCVKTDRPVFPLEEVIYTPTRLHPLRPSAVASMSEKMACLSGKAKSRVQRAPFPT